MIAPDAREARAKKLGRIATPVRCKTYSNVPLQGGFFSGAGGNSSERIQGRCTSPRWP